MKYCKKIIFLIIAVLTGMISLTSLSVKAQSSNIWQKVYSRSMQDDATSIKQTSDSGYIVCAVTNAGSALSVIWLFSAVVGVPKSLQFKPLQFLSHLKCKLFGHQRQILR